MTINAPKVICFFCQSEVDIEQIAPSARTGNNTLSCRSCRSSASHRYRNLKAGTSLRTYGECHAWYAAKLQAQQGRCAICDKEIQPSFIPNGNDPEKRGQRGGDKWRDVGTIDHNHATGQVRGILCGLCNAGLGMFQENPHALDMAILYLERYQGARSGAIAL